jgi:nicotinamidase-related amidase
MSQLERALIVVGLLLAIGSGAAIGEVQTPSCRTALLVIDVQTAWLITSSPLTADHVNVAYKIKGILDSVRAAGIPVVFVVDVSRRGSYSERMLAVASPIEVLDGELVIEKRNQDGFIATPLGDDLRAMGITTLLITGFASHECVASTVNGALGQGFEVVIIEDGHSGGENGRRAIQMNDSWRRRGLEVIPSGEIDFAALCAPADPEDGG